MRADGLSEARMHYFSGVVGEASMLKLAVFVAFGDSGF
jgi:hypothetical protein